MKRVVGILATVFLTTNMFGQATLEMDDQAETGDGNNALISKNKLANKPSKSETTHYVGERYGGGIVFHVTDKGQHGLISAVVDASTRTQRYYKAFADTVDFRGGVGAGKILTKDFNSPGDPGTEDDRVHISHETESYSDWYLATRYDLNKLYRNRHVIGGYADFARGWKKTEVSPLNAWYRSFSTGGRFTNGKDDVVYVRVIREF